MSFQSKGTVHWVGECCLSKTHRMCLRCFKQLPVLPVGQVTEYGGADGVKFYLLGVGAEAKECEATMQRPPHP